MEKPRILITGSGGMVGRNLIEHPKIGDFDVLAPRRAELDLCDYDAVVAYLAANQPNMIIHSAGKVGGIQANIREPVSFLMENIDMGRNIVWAARQAGIKRLINLGSSCMYPRDKNEPLKEEMILEGTLESTNEGYALAKVVTARLCEYIMREDPNFQYKTIIPCNLYGRHDKFDPEHSHLIPAIIHKIHQAKQRGETTVEIWGDGMARREFMYSGDLADALVQSIENFKTLPAIMNIGIGQDYTIREYYRLIAELMDYSGEFVYDPNKPVGMARKLLSIDRQNEWGWAAKSNLRTGVERTVAFYLTEYTQ